MPDNWSFVAAAYALTAVALGGYWRRLVRRERELTALATSISRGDGRRPSAPRTAPPRPEPASRPPRP
jgi:HAMP domain-containing protein